MPDVPFLSLGANCTRLDVNCLTLKLKLIHNVCFKKTMTHLLLYTVVSVSSFFETDVIMRSCASAKCDQEFIRLNVITVAKYQNTSLCDGQIDVSRV